jgi:hypothetical protein
MKKLFLAATIAIGSTSLTAAPLTWERLDPDKDGTCTKAEYMEIQKTQNPKAGPKAHGNWFKNIDKDKDGEISKAEWEKQQAAKAKRKAKEKAEKKKKKT